jgi:hypothetical protein
MVLYVEQRAVQFVGYALLNLGANPDTAAPSSVLTLPLGWTAMGYYDAEMKSLIERFWWNTFAVFAWLQRCAPKAKVAICALASAAQGSALGERLCLSLAKAKAAWFLAALDALGWLLALYVGTGRWLSAIFTVRWDPLGRSRQLIPLRGIRRGPRSFSIAGGTSERERRIVAWFYRWHEAPDDDDWRACLARFGLAACPAHMLLLEGDLDRAVKVAEIRLGGSGRRGERTVVATNAVRLASSGEAAGGDAGATGVALVSGPTPISGLSPARLIKDALAA